MPTIKGNLMFVSSRAAQVSEVWVRAPKVRTHSGGVVTTGNDRFPATNGEVTFTAVPGPAVLALISQGRAVDTIPILVGDSSTQTLRQVVSAAKVADDATRSELEQLALDAAKHVATTGADAKRAEDAANKTESAISAAIVALAPTGLKLVLAAPDDKTAEQADTAIRAKGYRAVVVVPTTGNWWE